MLLLCMWVFFFNRLQLILDGRMPSTKALSLEVQGNKVSHIKAILLSIFFSLSLSGSFTTSPQISWTVIYSCQVRICYHLLWKLKSSMSCVVVIIFVTVIFLIVILSFTVSCTFCRLWKIVCVVQCCRLEQPDSSPSEHGWWRWVKDCCQTVPGKIAGWLILTVPNLWTPLTYMIELPSDSIFPW